MIVANYLVSAFVFCAGLYTVLTRRNLIKMVMGLSLMEGSTYLLFISMAYRAGSTAPVLQNFCLTAIVIGVAVTAVFLTVVVRIAQHYRSLDADEIRQLRG